MNIPKDLLYTKTHEWVKKLPNGNVKVGLSDFAQHSLGDLVFVGLPDVGSKVGKGTSFADVESVKAVSEVFSPVDGKVVAINEALTDDAKAINDAPYDSWLIEVGNITAEAELLNPDQYSKLCEEGE